MRRDDVTGRGTHEAVGERYGSVGLRGGFVTVAGLGGKFLVQTASLVVLSRLLEPSDFGLIAIAAAIIAFGELVRDFGLTSASIRAQSLTQGQASNLFWLNIVIGAVLAVVLVLCAPVVADVFGDRRLEGVTRLLSLVFLINGIQAQHQANLTRSLEFKKLALSDVVGQSVGFFVACGAAVYGLGYWSLVVQYLFVYTTVAIWRIGASRWVPGRPRRQQGTMELLKFGGLLGGAQVLGYLSSNADTFIIGYRLSSADLGFYNRAYQLLLVPVNQILLPLTRVALPILSRVAESMEQFNNLFYRAYQVVSTIGVMLFSIVFLCTDDVVRIVLGSAWLGSAETLRVLSIGGMFQVFSALGYWVFLAKGISGRLLTYNMITKGGSIALIVVGSQWGVLGVAYAVTIGLVLSVPICYWYLRRYAALEVGRIALHSVTALASAVIAGALLHFLLRFVTIGNPFANVAVCGVLMIVLILVGMLTQRREREDFVRLGREVSRSMKKA